MVESLPSRKRWRAIPTPCLSSWRKLTKNSTPREFLTIMMLTASSLANKPNALSSEKKPRKRSLSRSKRSSQEPVHPSRRDGTNPVHPLSGRQSHVEVTPASPPWGWEVPKKHPTGWSREENNPNTLLEKSYFHLALFTDCHDVVIFSYKQPADFTLDPQNFFSLKPFQFYKVIDVMWWFVQRIVLGTESSLARMSPCQQVSRWSPAPFPSSTTSLSSVNITSPTTVDRYKSPIMTQVARSPSWHPSPPDRPVAPHLIDLMKDRIIMCSLYVI